VLPFFFEPHIEETILTLLRGTSFLSRMRGRIYLREDVQGTPEPSEVLTGEESKVLKGEERSEAGEDRELFLQHGQVEEDGRGWQVKAAQTVVPLLACATMSRPVTTSYHC